MSEVSVCNLALSHLGETATVASINPPDNSVQAQLCAQFYWTARNALLEMASWGFATRRTRLALLAPKYSAECSANGWHHERAWRFAYAVPSAMLNALAVQSKDAPDDYEAWIGPDEMRHRSYPQGYQPVPGAPEYVPQPFQVETLQDGTQVVLTNVHEAVMRYTTLVEDTTKFSPLFAMTLSHLLASMLAGPILKGDAGIAQAEKQLELATGWQAKAVASDANQRKTRVEAAPAWIRGR